MLENWTDTIGEKVNFLAEIIKSFNSGLKKCYGFTIKSVKTQAVLIIGISQYHMA